MAGASGYVQAAYYTPWAELEQTQLGTSTQSLAKQAWVTNEYEPGTGRLKRATVKAETQSWLAQDLNYGYDLAGNVLSVFDPATMGGTGKADYQCFQYDALRRLSEAWTPSTASCATSNRTTAKLGGAAPYWTSYTYNDAGLRLSQTDHAAAGDTRTAYTYSSTKPHQLVKLVKTPPVGGATTRTFSYDAAGNTVSRYGVQAQQTLTWDAEGELVRVQEPAVSGKPAKDTGYLYDADGELLMRRPSAATGDTVLYLGGTEVRLKADGSLAGTRYYQFAGQTVAVRSATASTNTLSWLVSDHHGTSTVAITADAAQKVTKRYTTPFGGKRGPAAAWVDDKGFLGKPSDDATGLIQIGARQYAPGIGRFISVDPILDTTNALSLNGYTYAENNPLTRSDPTGLKSGVMGCGNNSQCLAAAGGSRGAGSLSDVAITTTTTSNTPPASTGNGGDGGSGDGGDAPWYVDVGKAVGGVGKAVGGVGKDIGQGAWGAVKDTGTGLWSVASNPVGSVKNYIATTTAECGIMFATGACLGMLMLKDAKHQYETKGFTEATSYVITNIGLSVVGTKGANAGLNAASKAGAASRAASMVGGGHGIPGPSCSWNSFAPTTLVLMADGTAKPIKDIEVGDEVLATDPESGETAKKPVTQLIVGSGIKELTDVTITTPGGAKVITATSGHPFWNASDQSWEGAAELEPGDSLATNTGRNVPVAAVRDYTRHQTVHNLTVADIHTYYVLAGDMPVLVHNCGRLTVPQQKDLAKFLGYTPVRGVHGKAKVFQNKKPGPGQPRFISPDIDQHNGGVFKGANEIEDLISKKSRSGTYDLDIVDGEVLGLVRSGD